MSSFRGAVSKCLATISSLAGGGTKDVHVLGASFAPAGAGAPTALLGADFSVTHTGTGQWTVQLARRAKATLFATASGQFATPPAGDDITISTCDVSNLGQAVITYAPNGTPTDIAANALNRVHFLIIMAV